MNVRPTSRSSDQAEQGMYFTLIPQILDAVVERSGESNALRSTNIKTDHWRRNRHDVLLADSTEQLLSPEDIKKENDKK